MALHLIKLSVGSESFDDLAHWVAWHQQQRATNRQVAEHIHTTRMVPKRRADLLDGGSIYWVIKGQIQARQTLIDIRPFTDREGIKRCDLVMAPKLIATRWQPKRPFQGWRYLKPEDAPADLADGADNGAAMPTELRAELTEMGLL